MDSVQHSFIGDDNLNIDWSTRARTASFNERDILRWIMELFNGGKPFEADACYSLGNIYDDLPRPRLRFDLKPQTPETIAADCRMLPLADASITSLVYDPPFNARAPGTNIFNGGRNTPTRFNGMSRYSSYPTEKELLEFYAASLTEFARVFVPRGLLVVKIQDCVGGGHRLWASDYIIRQAGSNFDLIERFVLLRDAIAWRNEPKHFARSNHCYWLVFRKV